MKLSRVYSSMFNCVFSFKAYEYLRKFPFFYSTYFIHLTTFESSRMKCAKSLTSSLQSFWIRMVTNSTDLTCHLKYANYDNVEAIHIHVRGIDGELCVEFSSIKLQIFYNFTGNRIISALST